MKLQLPILFFVSLFTCVGVFYWSQLNITISYGETARQHRRHHGFSTLDYGRSEDRLNAAEQEPAQVGVNAHRHRRRRRRRGTHNHTRSSSELEPAQVQKLEQLRQQSQQMQREAKAAAVATAKANTVLDAALLRARELGCELP